MVTRPAPIGTPNVILANDAKALWSIFQHNRNSTLDYGWLRNRLLRIADGKLSNDRQNAALDYLEHKGLIEKVTHGKWRFVKPDRVSATVVASAPVTPEIAAQIVPRFKGAMTDAVYSMLREHNRGMTTREITTFLGVQNDKKQYNNCTASLAQLEKSGWVDIDRTSPKRLVYTARTVNKLGRPASNELLHALAPNGQAKVETTPPADPPIPQSIDREGRRHEQPSIAPTNGKMPAPVHGKQPRVFTLEQVQRYAKLVADRAALIEKMAPLQAELLALDAELEQYT